MKAKTNRITETNDNYTNHVIKNLHSIHSQIYESNQSFECFQSGSRVGIPDRDRDSRTLVSATTHLLIRE